MLEKFPADVSGASRSSEAFEYLVEHIEYGKLPEHARGTTSLAIASLVLRYRVCANSTGKVAG